MSAFPELTDPVRVDVLKYIFCDIVPEDPLFWAFGAIAGVNELASLLYLSSQEKNVISDITTWTSVLKIWITNGRMQWNWPRAQRRDNYTCLLTGATDSSALGTRICRFAPGCEMAPPLSFYPAIQTFWNRLCKLFTVNRVRRWEAAVGRAQGSLGILQNMVCLSEPARRLWKLGRFALKPLSSSSSTPSGMATSLTVEFHWIWRQGNERFAEPPALFNHRTGNWIRSGDIFTLYTNDPVFMPLPSVDILDMQWVLTRAVGLARASLGPKVALLLDTNDPEIAEDVSGEMAEDEPESEDGDRNGNGGIRWETVASMIQGADDKPAREEDLFATVGLYNAALNFDELVIFPAIAAGSSGVAEI